MKLFSPPSSSSRDPKDTDVKMSQGPNRMDAMWYDEKEQTFKFNEEFVEGYKKYLWEEKYKSQAKKNPWNNPQLGVIVETVIAFIEQISKTYTPRKFHGCDLWLLNELWETNNYVGTRGYVTRGNDLQFRKITDPLAEQRNKICRQGEGWLRDFEKEIENPYFLFVGYFSRLNLQAYQSQVRVGFNKQQRLEAMHILNELLSIAMHTLQNSPIYQKAAATEGQFYHKLVPEKISREGAVLLMKPKEETLTSEMSATVS